MRWQDGLEKAPRSSAATRCLAGLLAMPLPAKVQQFVPRAHLPSGIRDMHREFGRTLAQFFPTAFTISDLSSPIPHVDA
jgi:hypothetical protein